MKNFKLPVLLVLCLGMTVSTFAQLSIGARTGVRIAQMSDFADLEEVAEVNNRIGLETGAIVSYRFSPFFSLQSELNFVQKGVEVVYVEEDGFSGSGKIGVNYLEFAPLARLSYGSGSVEGFLLVGPSIGYGLNGTIITEETFLGETFKEEDDLDFDEDEFARTDFGAIFGLGLGFNLGNDLMLTVDGRYNMGFTNLATDEDVDMEPSNRGISASIGLLVPLSK